VARVHHNGHPAQRDGDHEQGAHPLCGAGGRASHNVDLDSIGGREVFAVNSVEYSWIFVGVPFFIGWPRLKLVLVKKLPGGRIEYVAKYWNSGISVLQSGVLALDARLLDPLVALVTLFVTLEKMRRP
jgi:hypothetical protein